MPHNDQINILSILSDNEEDHRDSMYWDDMPEFVQKKKEAPYMVMVRFRNKEDLAEFADKIEQPQLKGDGKRGLKSTWYPRLAKGEGGTSGDLVWVIGDEENDTEGLQ